MITSIQLINNLKSYIYSQIDVMASSTPIVCFLKPLITRALDKNIHKIKDFLSLVSDNEGNIDAENIISEMIESLMSTTPFIYKTSFMGDIEIGGGEIKLNLPLTNKRLVLNTSDLETFKEMVTTKG